MMMQRAQRRGGPLLRVLPLLLLLPATGCKRSLVVVLPAQGTASPLLSSPSGNASALCIAAGSHWCGSPSESHCSSDCTLARFGLLPPGAPSKSWRCYSPKCFNGSGTFNHRAPGCNICTSLLAQFMAKCKLHPPPPPPPPLPPPGNYTGKRWLTFYNSVAQIDAGNMVSINANLVWSTNLTDLNRIAADSRYNTTLSCMWSIEAFCQGEFGVQIWK